MRFNLEKFKRRTKIGNKKNKTMITLPATWEEYYKQYVSALNCFIVSIDSRKEFNLNTVSMPFLFLFQHSVELMLKANLYNNKGINYPGHSLEECAKQISEEVLNEIYEMRILDLHGSGERFRYWDDDDLKKDPQIIDAYSSLRSYQSLANLKLSGLSIYEPIKRNLPEKDKLWHCFRFHEVDIKGFGVIHAMYQCAANYLLKRVYDGESDIADIYIPILFLLRHSIELILKSNLQDIHDLENIDGIEIGKGHSLEKLFNTFNSLLTRLSNNSDDAEIKKSIDEGIQESSNLVRLAQSVDCKSYNFRYPIDQKGNPNKLTIRTDIISQWYDLYCQAQSFLDFVIPFLQDCGLIDDPDTYDRD